MANPPRARAPSGASPASLGLTAAAVGVGAVLALVIFMVIGDAAPTAAVPGIPGAGAVVGWLLPISRLVMDLAAVGTVGCLLFAAYLIPGPERESQPAQRSLRTASWCALAWAVSAALGSVLTLADISGLPLTELITSASFADSLVVVDQSRSLLLVVALAVLVFICARRVSTAEGPLLVLILAMGTLVPPLLTGHASSHSAHELAILSLSVHVLAATAWVGGLAALLSFRHSASKDAATVARFSTLALGCFVATALSGLVNAWIPLADGDGALTELFTSSYGWLVLGKVAALGVLAGFGWWHRRHTLVQLAAGRPGAFQRLAGREVLVMVGAIALAVALSRTPTPTPGGAGDGLDEPVHQHTPSLASAAQLPVRR